jgi:uncharacterized protein (DUF305 family)
MFVIAGALLAIGLLGILPAQARDAMSSTAIDCSKADTMMMQPAGPAQPANASGDIDKDFARTMMLHNTAMIAKLKEEIACGKDAKAKAMARKTLDQTTVDDGFLRQLLAGGG